MTTDYMEIALIITLALVLYIYLTFFSKFSHRGFFKRILGKTHQTSYKVVGSVLTKPEHYFFDILDVEAGERYHILAKTRLEDVIEVPKTIPYKERWSLRGRIKSRHLDFLLCDPHTMAPVLAIELDDGSHNSASRKKADEFLNQALSHAGLKLKRVKIGNDFSLVVKSLLSELK